jgi:hypothetical protein
MDDQKNADAFSAMAVVVMASAGLLNKGAAAGGAAAMERSAA